MTSPRLSPSRSLSRRYVLRTAVAGAAGLAARGAPASARSAEHRFVSLGDWGRRGHDDQRAVGLAMGKSADRINPAYVLSVGDNFYEDGVASVRDPQWISSFESIYAAPSLQVPWRAVLGNHDYRGSVQAQLAYQDGAGRWRLPARYYQMRERLDDGTICDFFYIDTNPFLSRYRGTKVRTLGQDAQAQLRWLDRALGASQAPWKIVVGHHPIHTAHGGKLDEPELIAAIAPLLQAHGVRIYLNGHVHNLQHIKVGGIDYITNGAGSRIEGGGDTKPGSVAFLTHGFMTAHLDKQVMAFAFVGIDGQQIYAAAVPRVA